MSPRRINVSYIARTIGTMLAERGLTKRDLALRLEVSDAYVSGVTTGKKKASPQWADLVANALGLDEEDRRRVHEAAARDIGFRL